MRGRKAGIGERGRREATVVRESFALPVVPRPGFIAGRKVRGGAGAARSSDLEYGDAIVTGNPPDPASGPVGGVVYELLSCPEGTNQILQAVATARTRRLEIETSHTALCVA